MSDLKTILSNCDAKRDHNYRLGADNFTITTAEYHALREAALNSARPEAGVAPEIRTNPDGSLDEVVAENCSFHLEQMDVDHWWMAVEAGGKRVAVWLHGRGKIKASWEQEARATSPLPQPNARQEEK